MRVDLPRGKTGISRNLPLWSETVHALNEVPVSGELLFCTRKGNPWVKTEKGIGKDGKENYIRRAFVEKENSFCVIQSRLRNIGYR
jgi:hypothetical protein